MNGDADLADVTYRATRAGGGEASLRLRLPAAAATAADGWARLSALHGPVDPTTIEIEIRAAAVGGGARPVVRVVGLEPTLCRQKRSLSPSRLPFRHTRAADADSGARRQ